MTTGAQLRADLARELAVHGRRVVLVRKEAGSYDPDTGGTTTTTHEFEGVGRVGSYRDSQIDGVSVLRGDRRVTFQPDDSALVPAAGDMVTIDDVTWRVIFSQARELSGEWFSYTLQVRRGG